MDDVIEFRVDGLPPIKNEALSLFSPLHGQKHAVEALRRAARGAVAEGFVPWSDPIALEVTVDGEPTADATNYLGGIGDVLQKRRTNLDQTDFGIFADDKQIREITYRVVPDAINSYAVRITRLSVRR